MDTIFKDRNGEPVFVLGLQSHNSSNGDREMLRRSIDAVKAYHGNTVEVPVYWYQLEPEEGVFDLSMVDSLIDQVRDAGLYLIILWFGFSKNADLTYMPDWAKRDKKRFKLAIKADGGVVPMMSPHCSETVEADRKAFARLIEEIRDRDKNERTVIAVQVENEVGLYPADRDYSKKAQTDFDMGVPEELKGIVLEDSGASMKDDSWYGRFGRYAHEAFSSWYFGRAIERIASAGNEIYPELPLIMNTIVGEVRQEVGGQSYSSGAPVGRTIPIWQKAAPSIKCFGADIYMQDMESYLRTCRSHLKNGNMLFIPETGTGGEGFALNHIHAAADLGAIGICGFGAESTVKSDGTLTDAAKKVADSFEILSLMAPVIKKYGGTDRIFGVTQKEFQSYKHVKREKYHITFNFTTRNEKGALLGRNMRIGALLNDAPDAFDRRGRAVVFEASPTEYYIAGVGFTARFLKRTDPDDHFPTRTYQSRAATELTAFTIEEGHFGTDGSWVCEFVRRGDEIDCGAFLYPGIVLRVVLNPDACVAEDW